VIVHELEAAKRLKFYAETKEKSCSDLQHEATIWQTLQLSFEFNEATVLRFTASKYDFSVSGNFPIKGKLFSEGKGGNFGERN